MTSLISTAVILTMKSFVLVLLIFLTPVVTTRACSGEDLLQSENATECAFEYGTYTGFKEELAIELVDPSAETHLCFYVPDIINCLHDDEFLSCKDQSNCTQHEREDVINSRDNETMRNITVNFRMMPPDDKKDEAYVIRLYNRTVVWLTNGSCWGPHELSQRRIYMYYNLSNCTTNTTTILPKTTDNTCSMTASPTITPLPTDTRAAATVAGICIPSVIGGVIAGVIAGCFIGV